MLKNFIVGGENPVLLIDAEAKNCQNFFFIFTSFKDTSILKIETFFNLDKHLFFSIKLNANDLNVYIEIIKVLNKL